jgi:Flp pilus assembly protein CpaB
MYINGNKGVDVMTLQRIKTILIVLFIIAFFAGICFILFYSYYKPVLQRNLQIQMNNSLRPQPVYVASKDILRGNVITQDSVTQKQVPSDIISTYGADLPKDSSEIVGKVAKENIYANEQILKSRTTELTPQQVQPSSRFITVNIPKYNFVNGKVSKGSLVDILVDKGQGRYDVVLSKIMIHDIDKVNTTNSLGNSNQQKKPAPKPIFKSTQEPTPNVTAPSLLYENNPALSETDDYTITILVTEKEQKRVQEATIWGKLATRLYIYPDQRASKITFFSLEERKVKGDGTIIPPVVKPKVTPTAQTTNTTTAPTTTVPATTFPTTVIP